MKKLALAFAFSLTVALPAASQTDERLPQLIEAALPMNIGSPDLVKRLLSPAPGTQLSRAFDEKNVEKFVDDKLPNDPCCKDSPRCVLQNDRGSALRIDLTRGRVRYSSRERSANKEATTLPPDRQIMMARAAAAAFGIPAAELSAPDFRYLHLTAANPDLPDTRPISFRAEGHVRFQRQIGGILVAFSKFFTAVDARGQIARAYARWPDFALTAGLRPEQALSRAEVVIAIYEELAPRLRPGTTERLRADVVYAPANSLQSSEGGDEMSPTSAGQTDTVRQISFAPALLVTVVPVAQPDNSGIPQMPVQNLVFPLFQGPAVDAPSTR